MLTYFIVRHLDLQCHSDIAGSHAMISMFPGCMAMMALCRENVYFQNKICEEGGIEPLVRLIKSTKSSEKVLLTAIRALGILCIGKEGAHAFDMLL